MLTSWHTSWMPFCPFGRCNFNKAFAAEGAIACFSSSFLLVSSDAERARSMVLLDLTMRVLYHANLSPHEIAEIEAQLLDQENLKDVMNWALSCPAGTFMPGVVADVIVQDEFTHDVVVPWRDGLVLVYDTT